MNDENQHDDDPRDLLGAPYDQANETWGRPSFKKTEENQKLVGVLAAAGWKAERIARQIGCDGKTLRKHFSRELAQAADDAEAAALMTIHNRMEDGNVSAARHILALAEKGRAAPPQPKSKPDEKPAEDPEAGMGKKERQAARAQSPSGIWGDLLH
ncbi:MAG: hypothetical protein AAGA19_15275 [Pseudomonadota bacterium]